VSGYVKSKLSIVEGSLFYTRLDVFHRLRSEFGANIDGIVLADDAGADSLDEILDGVVTQARDDRRTYDRRI